MGLFFHRRELPLPRIVIEAFLDDLVSTPALKSQFVLLEELAIVGDELEYPVDHGTVALDKERRHRKRTHFLVGIEHLLLAGNKIEAPAVS